MYEGKYRVNIKNGAAWRLFSACRLQVSVGKANHEGRKFEATVEWAQGNFGKVILCVNDTLQRFNLMTFEGLSEEEAMARSLRLGQEWLGRNAVAISQLETASIDYKIYHWNHWLQHEKFLANLEVVNALYQTNATFRNAIEADINSFLSRRPVPNPEIFRQNSRRYLLEESAVFAIMFEEEEAADVYPGSEINTTRIAREKSLPSIPPGLEKRHFTRIDFRRRVGV